MLPVTSPRILLPRDGGVLALLLEREERGAILEPSRQILFQVHCLDDKADKDMPGYKLESSGCFSISQEIDFQ